MPYITTKCRRNPHAHCMGYILWLWIWIYCFPYIPYFPWYMHTVLPCFVFLYGYITNSCWLIWHIYTYSSGCLHYDGAEGSFIWFFVSLSLDMKFHIHMKFHMKWWWDNSCEWASSPSLFTDGIDTASQSIKDGVPYSETRNVESPGPSGVYGKSRDPLVF